ncbi:hypothetical protein HIM_02933 [Hirsutella minnesotensis 3608]|nr:hypothetical protein HIM_02933 [Hirsutella minnesotensis 3608]
MPAKRNVRIPHNQTRVGSFFSAAPVGVPSGEPTSFPPESSTMEVTMVEARNGKTNTTTGKEFIPPASSLSSGIAIAQDASREIRQVIFASYHGQCAFSNSQRTRGALWDLVYNSASEFAGVHVICAEYFTWRSIYATATDEVGLRKLVGRKWPHLLLADVRKTEQQRGQVFPAQTIVELFPSYVSENPELKEKVFENERKGLTPSTAIRKFMDDKVTETKRQGFAKRKAEEIADENPSPSEPKKALTAKQKAYFASERSIQGRARGNAKRQAPALEKYLALKNTQQVQHALANRYGPAATTDVKRILDRFDQTTEPYEHRDEPYEHRDEPYEGKKGKLKSFRLAELVKSCLLR